MRSVRLLAEYDPILNQLLNNEKSKIFQLEGIK